MAPYDPPQMIKTEVVAAMPEKYGRKGSSPGRTATRYARPQVGVDFYLEGPAFDRAGNLYFVDVPHGRIFRMDPDLRIELAAEYDGEPNGLAIHRDGRIFIADFRHGIMVLDPASGAVTPFLDLRFGENFRGLNDLCFSSTGDLYFTDQGQTGLHDPTGRVYRWATSGRLECMIATVSGPNGVCLSPDDKTLYVGSRANQVWWIPLDHARPPSRSGVFASMAGFGTPDGMAVDVEGNVVCAQMNMGVIWVFGRTGLPTYRIDTCKTAKMSNMAYGGPDNRRLYITDGAGFITAADMPAPGLRLYSHT